MFTKYDQFLCDVKFHLEDFLSGHPYDISEEAEKQFQEHYLHPLGKGVRFVRLESVFTINCLVMC